MCAAAAGLAAARRLADGAAVPVDVVRPVLAAAAVGLMLVVVAGAAVAVARRSVTRPLDRLLEAVERLGSGDLAARAPADAGPGQVRALARAVNCLAATVSRERAVAIAAERTAGRIRRRPSIQAAMDEAADGLGDTLAADRVTVRYSDPDGDSAVSRWRRPASSGRDDDHDLSGGDDMPAAGRLPSGPWTTADPRTAEAAALPAPLRAALLAAGAGPVMFIPFDAGAHTRGIATLIRAVGSAPWTEQEVAAAGSVASRLGDALRQVRLRQRENDLVTRLMEMDDAKLELMRTISHELRTPLASVVGYVETLRDGGAGPVSWDQDRMLAVVERNAERLRVLIENILNVSRIQAHTPPNRRYPVDLARLVSQSVTAIGPAAAGAGVHLECRVHCELPARVDPEQIRRTLMSLLSNAVKFTRDRGRVEVTATRAGNEIVIRVVDTGIGVPDRDKGGLFTPFFRASNATDEAFPGAGLGLAMAQTIVASHGGRIELASTEGSGTTVTVHLPAAEPSGLVQGRTDLTDEGPAGDRLGD